jgi:hypothetical protein
MPILPSSSPALLIFDCDGVLIDSEPIAGQLSVTMLGELGHVIELAAFQRLATGRSRAQWMAGLGQYFCQPLPGDFPDWLADRLRDAFEAALQPMPGIGGNRPATLRRFQQRPRALAAHAGADGALAAVCAACVQRRRGRARQAGSGSIPPCCPPTGCRTRGRDRDRGQRGRRTGRRRRRDDGAWTVFDDMRELPPLINRPA